VSVCDKAEKMAEECKKSTVSGDYDITLRWNSPENGSKAVFRAFGRDSAKVLKYAVSAVIVAGGAMIARKLQKGK